MMAFEQRSPRVAGFGCNMRLGGRGKCSKPGKLPPYGREVMDALAAGHSCNVRLYACRPDPWSPARRHRDASGPGSTLVLPVDADPAAIHWPPLRDLIANVTGLPGDTLNALARALVRDGLELGYLLDRENPERNLRVIRRSVSP